MATLDDNVGSAACSDGVETAFAVVAVVAVAAAAYRRLTAAAATAVVLLSLHNALFGVAVRRGNPAAAAPYTRQAGMLAAYAALFAAYIVGTLRSAVSTPASCCVAYGWIGILAAFYGALSLAAFVYQRDAEAAAYEVLDWTGVALGAGLVLTA